MINPTN